MYSLHLHCLAQAVEQLSVVLWEEGTVGIREEDRGSFVELTASFEDTINRPPLSAQFADYSPTWEREDDTDWVAETHNAWPARSIGERIFLAPMWNTDATPPGRVRVIHNPGLASGTGEHPCTQLALNSIEQSACNGKTLIDVGTGSGILCTAALLLGARFAVGLDLDTSSLDCARENFELNNLQPVLVAGSAECMASQTADVLVANISGTVLLALADNLQRIARPGGWLILTGFPENELPVLQKIFGHGEISELNEWRCLRVQATIFR